MRDCRAATLNTVSPPLRDSYPATIMPLPRCRIPILTVAGLIEIAALHGPLVKYRNTYWLAVALEKPDLAASDPRAVVSSGADLLNQRQI